MRVVLICDVYPPNFSSGAIQLRDLSVEFAKAGHQISVLVASSKINNPYEIEESKNLQIVRLKTFKTRESSYIRRAVAETCMPLLMLINMWRSPLWKSRWDCVIWYSPTIFLGLFVYIIKKINKCKSYLIIRDIFPEWAADIGLISKNSLPYFYFKFIAEFQYSCADIVGIQSVGNAAYFEKWRKKGDRKLKVLDNWLGRVEKRECSINLEKSKLAGRYIFIYAGNMGIAQGLELIVESLVELKANNKLGFVFVGRGTFFDKISKMIKLEDLDNVLIYNEIKEDEIPSLYDQCHAGIISLDNRHKSHNIPGKFLSYIQNGLPVIAKVNENNDIIKIINDEKLGLCYSGDSIRDFSQQIKIFLKMIDDDQNLSSRCRNYYLKNYTPDLAVKKIIEAINE